ncbi:uncharacterized protein LOC134789056 [Penaeus indicus]|uniref:uncharacterized protein LOC134789056 n=1 Tax=Penaeus indicus TaxID=29960 RepID=UPI00300D0D4B
MVPVPRTKPAPPPQSTIVPTSAPATMPVFVPPTPLLCDCAPIYDMLINIGRSDTLGDTVDLYQKLDLDSSSVDKIREGSVSLMSVVEAQCGSSNNNVCKINTGIYYITKSHTVIKFLTKFTGDRIEDFLREIHCGLILKEVKGVVNIEHVYPEALCYEMPFLGLSLDYFLYDELRSNTFLPHFLCKCTTLGLAEDIDGKTLIVECTERLVQQLPNVIIEMANILMRLGDQQMVCLDIKPDNFVIDVRSGQPYLIDLGFMTAVGTRYSSYDFNIYPNERHLYPQSPPELLEAEVCVQKSMTYGLSFTLEQIVKRLFCKRYDVSLLSENFTFKKWIREGRQRDIEARPEIRDVINIVRTCYPMLPPIDV